MCFLGTFVLYLHFFRINSLFFVDYAFLVLSIRFEPGLFEVKADVVSVDAFFNEFKEYLLVLLFE